MYTHKRVDDCLPLELPQRRRLTMKTTTELPSASAGQQVPLASIRMDDSSQSRVKIHNSVVREYAQAMKQQQSESGLRFPAVVLFWDGRDYWLGDGFHRVQAAREAGLEEFLAEIHQGSRRDALLFAISANNTHGLP